MQLAFKLENVFPFSLNRKILIRFDSTNIYEAREAVLEPLINY